MREKVLIMTAALVREAWDKLNEELEAETKAKMSPRNIPWVDRILAIRVLSGEG